MKTCSEWSLTLSLFLQVHMVRGRAIEFRERTVKACVDKLASSSSNSSIPITDLTRYLVRASELILPPSVCSDPSSVSSSSSLAAAVQPLAYAPGINVSTAASILSTSVSGPSNSYTAGLIVEQYAQGLLQEGRVDAAAGLYLRLLLQLGDGDRELQSRALKNCLDCWAASSPDPLHQLASYIENHPTSDMSGSSAGPLQILELIDDSALALSLTERLLARLDASPLPEDVKEVARQTRMALILVQKASQLRLEMALGASDRGDHGRGKSPGPGPLIVKKGSVRGGTGERRQHEGRSLNYKDEDARGKNKGPLGALARFTRGIKGLAVGLVHRRGRVASGVFAAMCMIPRKQGGERIDLILKGVQAAAFLLAMSSSEEFKGQ